MLLEIELGLLVPRTPLIQIWRLMEIGSLLIDPGKYGFAV